MLLSHSAWLNACNFGTGAVVLPLLKVPIFTLKAAVSNYADQKQHTSLPFECFAVGTRVFLRRLLVRVVDCTSCCSSSSEITDVRSSCTIRRGRTDRVGGELSR